MRSQIHRNVPGGLALALCVGIGVGACAAPAERGEAERGQAQGSGVAPARAAVRPTASAAPSAPVAAWSRVLPWGAGPGEVGGWPRAAERRAAGPAAVAVGPGGEIFVLDAWNGRVLEVRRGGVVTAAAVPRDAQDLAVGPDGALAAWSPLRARVFLREPGHGGDAGEVAIPRALRLARGVLLGPSREVLVENAHQELYRIGSPAAARDLPAILRSKREGARLLPDGRGLAAVRRPDGRGELLLLGAGEHAPVSARHALPGPVLAARIMGFAAGVACLRLERPAADHGLRVSVERELYCLEAVSGAVRLRRALPLPAATRELPRRELALGGAPLRVAFLHPAVEGLRVEVWPVPAEADGRKEVRR